jgi:hypothetical protein
MGALLAKEVSSMIETTLEDIEKKARSLHAQGKEWHFHMLPMDCVFNERSDRYAFTVENRTDDETYVAYSSEQGAPSDPTSQPSPSKGAIPMAHNHHSEGAIPMARYTAIDLPQSIMDLGQRLVTMMYGDEILDQGTGSTESSSEHMRSVLRKAKEFNERGVYWHSHLLFPDCAFNKHKGKWNIVFECKATGDFEEVLFDDNPVDDLNRIEILYYEQK